MNFPLFISKGNSDSSNIVQFKIWVVLMEVRCYPAHPNIVWVLSREDSHWIEILHRKQQVSYINLIIPVQVYWY